MNLSASAYQVLRIIGTTYIHDGQLRLILMFLMCIFIKVANVCIEISPLNTIVMTDKMCLIHITGTHYKALSS